MKDVKICLITEKKNRKWKKKRKENRKEKKIEKFKPAKMEILEFDQETNIAIQYNERPIVDKQYYQSKSV